MLYSEKRHWVFGFMSCLCFEFSQMLIIFFQVTCTCIVILPVLFFFQDLTKKIPDVFKDAVIQGMLEFEWDLFIEAKRKVSIQYICIVLALLTQCLNNVKLISQLNSNLFNNRMF